MPNSFDTFESLAKELQYRGWENKKDLVRRLSVFYRELLVKMYPGHVCRANVETLLDTLDNPDRDTTYYFVWSDLLEDSRKHIINLANKLCVFLPPPRPISALAVKRLHRFYVQGDPKADRLVKDYLEKARQLGNLGVTSLIEKLSEKEEKKLKNSCAEDIADALYYKLHIETIPYLKSERPDGEAVRNTDNSIIPVRNMLVSGQAVPISTYSGDKTYTLLVGVFNGTLRGKEIFKSIIADFSLQGKDEDTTYLAVIPLSIVAVNAPDGKGVMKTAVRMKGIDPCLIDKGLHVLLQSGVIEEYEGVVRLIKPFKLNSTKEP